NALLSLQLSGSATGTLASVTAAETGRLYRVTVSDVAGDGEIGLTVGAGFACDAATNPCPGTASACYHVDRVAPAGPARFTRFDPVCEVQTNISIVTWQATFAEPVYGFEVGDVSPIATGVTCVVQQIAGMPGGTNFQVTVYVSGIDGTGTVAVALAAGAVTDAVGNPSAAGMQSEPYVLVQSLGQEAPPEPTVFLIVQSVGDHGAASPSPPGGIQVTAGGATTIVYTADDWYRITNLTVNGQAVPAAAGERTYAWTVSGVASDYSNEVSFAQSDAYDATVIDWLVGHGYDEDATPDSDPYGMETEYLLDLDPFADETVAFAVANIAAGANITVKVKLLVNGQPRSTIKGALRLYSRDSLLGGSWSLSGSQALPPGVFDGNGERSFTFPRTGTGRYYKAVVERE
ncbi:MAG: hypothetical protein PHR35_20900, partial [Kiritimatiellae bacterium]|nr:hypothetical protein [Kiritimatiellia bacterium]